MVADKIATLRDGQNKQGARIQPPAGKCEDVFAERKLAAYVGICEGDKELTDTVLPLVRQAIGELNDSSTALADLTKDAARRALEMRRVKRVLDHLDGREPEAAQPLLNTIIVICVNASRSPTGPSRRPASTAPRSSTIS